MYLIEHSEKWAEKNLPMRAKEVEVLDAKEIANKIYEDIAIPHAFLSAVTDYLAANNLQIIKTVK